MTTFKCEVCGKEHDELPLVLAYIRPAGYFKIPSDERNKRIFLNEDICVIDDSEFVIRGVLEIPIQNKDEHFEWGVWAIVDQTHFKRYLELWESDEADDEPNFTGQLSGGMDAYPDSDLLEVEVRLRSGNKRPLFFVVSDDHPLGRDQRIGISMEKAHQFIAQVLPHLFESNKKPTLAQKFIGKFARGKK